MNKSNFQILLSTLDEDLTDEQRIQIARKLGFDEQTDGSSEEQIIFYTGMRHAKPGEFLSLGQPTVDDCPSVVRLEE